jgi:K+-sensing histidine kinase KdpD
MSFEQHPAPLRSRKFGRDLLVTIGAVAIASALRVLLAPVLYDRASFVLFTLAVMTSAWTGGWRMGLIATVLASVAGVWLFITPFDQADLHSVRDAVQIGLFAFAGCGISFFAERLHMARLRAEQETREREKLIGELREAISHVRTLRGLIPICAGCKKIRDDRGYWEQLEVYIRDHSEAQFSHGLCPDCVKKYWDDISEAPSISE